MVADAKNANFAGQERTGLAFPPDICVHFPIFGMKRWSLFDSLFRSLKKRLNVPRAHVFKCVQLNQSIANQYLSVIMIEKKNAFYVSCKVLLGRVALRMTVETICIFHHEHSYLTLNNIKFMWQS